MINAVGPRMMPIWNTDSFQNDELVSHGQGSFGNIQPSQTLPSQSAGLWQLRNTVPLASAAPLVAGTATAQPHIKSVWQRLVHNVPVSLSSQLTPLSKITATGFQSGQSVSDGLREMFMARDKYRQAQIEADVKEAQARQANSQFHWEATLDDLVHQQQYDNAWYEQVSRQLSEDMNTSSRIIHNF